MRQRDSHAASSRYIHCVKRQSIGIRDAAAGLSCRDVMHFVTLWLWSLTFWPNIHWWARYRDGLSLCQVWRFEFQPYGFIVRTDRITDADDCVSSTLEGILGAKNIDWNLFWQKKCTKWNSLKDASSKNLIAFCSKRLYKVIATYYLSNFL